MSIKEAKDSIDKVIKKGRIHLYKPIQIAEILHRSKTRGDVAIDDLESYRNASKRWRDAVSIILVGNVSTSSQRYQDNLFDENAVPPRLLLQLDKENREHDGIVENYIYQKCVERWGLLLDINKYLLESTPESFDLKELVGKFSDEAGLKRSIDKVYEIIVYALFSTLVEELGATVSLELENPDSVILEDFANFIELVLGLPPGEKKLTLSASLYRAGVANAADLGIDILTNFGPIVQVKHISLDKEAVEEIASKVSTERIIIVCKDEDVSPIQSVLMSVGWRDRIQGIISLNDLSNWYDICLSKYQDSMGVRLLEDLHKEYAREFPLVMEVDHFLGDRGYNPDDLEGIWADR